MVQIIKKQVRKNGFGCPVHPTQIFTYILYIGDLISYYMINMVSLSHNQALVIILGTIYLILALFTLYYGYMSTHIDPTDPTIELEKECKN